MSTRARSRKREKVGRDTSPSGEESVALVGVVAALMAVIVVETGSVSQVWMVVAAVATVFALLEIGLWGRR